MFCVLPTQGDANKIAPKPPPIKNDVRILGVEHGIMMNLIFMFLR